MNKNRLEALSDGVFAIVMTLLIIDIKVPETHHALDNDALWHALFGLWPLLLSYFVSFAVLAVFWLQHHFFYHTFAKNIDRGVNLMNMFFLMFLSLVPFSAHLLGVYRTYQPAVVVYGINVVLLAVTGLAMLSYVLRSHHLRHDGLSPRIVKQALIRTKLTLLFPVIGLAVSFVSVHASLFFFAFPVVFNMIPGTLDFAEKMLGFEL